MNRTARVVVLVAWMALIAYWSGRSNLPIDQPAVADVLQGNQHPIAHVIAYGLVALLARWAFDGLPRAALWAVVLASAFGAGEEWLETFTPGRNGDIKDWAVDTVTAVLAVVVLAGLRATRLEPVIRRLAPLAVAAAFVVGIALIGYPSLPAPLHAASLRSAAQGALQLVRDTRNAARELRSSVGG